MSDSTADILTALKRVRRRVRWLLALDGAAVLIVLGLVTVATLATLDWWVRFPWYVRTLFLATGAGMAAAWCWRRVIRPLTAPIPLEQIAMRLGEMNATDRDRLVSAVSYLGGRGSGAEVLWQQVIARSGTAGLRDALAGLRSMRAFLTAALAILVLTIAACVHLKIGDLSDIARSRVLAPWAQIEWPRQVRIMPLTGDMTVAFGERATIAMRLERGDDPYLRAFVEWGARGSRLPRSRTVMQREADGVYRHIIDDVRAPIEYAFIAGDDDTLGRINLIRVARRPEAVMAQLEITPPVYTRMTLPETHLLTGEPIAALRDSTARLEVKTGLGDDKVREGWVTFSTGQQIELVPEENHSGILSAAFLLTESVSFHYQLADIHGLESLPSQKFDVTIRDDVRPTIAIEEPAGDVEMTTQGIVDLHVRAKDDFGIAQINLVTAGDGSPSRVLKVLYDAEDSSGENLPETVGRPPLTEHELTDSLPLRTMSPPPGPGAVIELAAECFDFRDPKDASREPGRSTVRRIRIVSEADFAESLRQSLVSTGSRLRRLGRELQRVRVETSRLGENPARRQAMTPDDHDRANEIAGELKRIEEAGLSAARRLSDLTRHAEQNSASRLDAAMQARRLERTVQRLSREPIREAADAIRNASGARDHAEQRASLEKALAAEDQALSEFTDILNGLDRWNEFADFARLVHELLERQETLIQRCDQLAQDHAGKPLKELSDSQRAGLDQVNATQASLRDDTAGLLRGMRERIPAVGLTDPAAAEALDHAIKAAAETAVLEQLASAVLDISKNRLRNARQPQQRATAGYRAMIEALESRPERELAFLSRVLDDGISRLKKIITAQATIHDETLNLPKMGLEPADTEHLADRQRALAGVTLQVSKDLSGAEHDLLAAQFALTAAASDMTTAGDLLAALDVSQGRERQDSARLMLSEALAALEALNERAEKDMAERTLAGLHEKLVELRTAQADIHQETHDLAHRYEPSAAELSRADLIRLRSLTRRQSELIEPAESLGAQMKGSIVFRTICDRVVRGISMSAGNLSDRHLTGAADVQGQVLVDLDRMIGALETRPKRKDRRFVDADSAGGGGAAGQPTLTRPVPPLAELRMLRMLQDDLRGRTAQMNDALPVPALRTAEHQAAVNALGDEQAALFELAQRLIEREQEGPQ